MPAIIIYQHYLHFAGKKEQIISIDTEIEQKKPKLPNSVAISKFGDIYWTDSSHEFELHDGVFALLADGTGRLIHYNPVTKQNKVLISGLQFANGVVLSPDEEFVLVAETGKSMIHRYYLKGTKKGKTDVFIEGLPGLPDNLKNNGDGFLVPLVVAKDYYHPALLQVLGPFPLVRKFVARIFGLTEVFFGTVEKIYPNFYSKAALHIVRTLTVVANWFFDRFLSGGAFRVHDVYCTTPGFGSLYQQRRNDPRQSSHR